MAKKKETDTQLEIKPTTEIAVADQHLDDWGEAPHLSQRDIIIPNVMLMQGMSEAVTDGNAAFGELRDSVSKECLGSFAKPMEFIPFHMRSVWVEKVPDEGGKSKDGWAYLRTVEINAKNDDLPYEEKDGSIKRIRTMQFYVLLPHEIASGSALPKLVSFRSTSLRAGRELATQVFISNRQAGLSPAGRVFELSVTKTKNDKGTFGVLGVKAVRNSKPEELAAALNWFKTVKTATNIKVDESEYEDTATDDSAEPTVHDNTKGPGRF